MFIPSLNTLNYLFRLGKVYKLDLLKNCSICTRGNTSCGLGISVLESDSVKALDISDSVLDSVSGLGNLS